MHMVRHDFKRDNLPTLSLSFSGETFSQSSFKLAYQHVAPAFWAENKVVVEPMHPVLLC